VLSEWVISIMDRLGGPGAGLIIALENLFPPIPSEVVLPLAGFTASRGELTLVGAVGWTTLGSLVGAVVLYGLGRRLGEDRIRRLAVSMPLLNVRDVDRTVGWFDRHGGKAVFFGRMIPLFRSLVSIPAGTSEMPVGRFLILTAAGSLIWNTGLITAGYFLGERWELVQSYADVLQQVLLAAGGIVVAWFVIGRLRARQSV
jgi:membrane protein DedA with SNARE-associated domain